MIKNFLTNFNLFTLASFFNFFISFANIILLTNYISPQQFGIFSFAQNIFFILYSISFSNYYLDLTNELVKNLNKEKYFISNYFYLNLITSIIIYLFLAITISFLNLNFTQIVIILILNFQLILLPFTILYYDLFVQKEFKSLGMASIIVNLLSFITKFFIVKYHSTLFYLSLSFTFDVVINAILINFIHKKKNKTNFQNYLIFNKNEVYQLFIKLISFPILGILTIFSYRIDILMIGFLSTYENTALYSIASRIALGINAIYMILIKFVYPALSKKQKNNVFILKLFRRLNGIALILTLLIFFFLFLFGDSALSLFGDYYKDSLVILYILIPNIFFIFMLDLKINFLFIKNNFKKIIKIFSLYLILNVVLNYVFILNYGFEKAAVATLLSSILTLLIFTDIQTIIKNIGFYFLLSSWMDIKRVVRKNILK